LTGSILPVKMTVVSLLPMGAGGHDKVGTA
jgi:hypothetical protein